MKIIVEGIDGSGKSVLTKQLARDLKMEIFWPGGPPSNNLDIINKCKKQLAMDNIIFDRVTCISDQCYHIPMDATRLGILKFYLLTMLEKSIVIYCTGCGELSNDGYNDKKHEEFVKKNINIIQFNYFKLMSMIPYLKYDFKINSYESLLQTIRSYYDETMYYL